MKRKMTNKITCLLTLIFLTGMGIWLLGKTPDAYSVSERRVLARDRTFRSEDFIDGTYSAKFETYALDQFPLRDMFRSIKALTEQKLFWKKDNNGLYQANGHLVKMEYPFHTVMVRRSAERIEGICEKYLAHQGTQAYLAIIPDKNAFLAEEKDVLKMDYELLYDSILTQLGENVTYIEINELLEANDFYRTDPHWKQENLEDISEVISSAMGVAIKSEYQTHTLENPFYGAYARQWTLPVKSERIKYLTNHILEHCIVTGYDRGTPEKKSVYDIKKGTGRDPYEVFLSGAQALLTIENPNAVTDRELVLFRDSFGSSLAPLLMEGYAKITLIDLRYISSDRIGEYVTFHNQDVLFLYSTLLINQGLGGGY